VRNPPLAFPLSLSLALFFLPQLFSSLNEVGKKLRPRAEAAHRE